jgi:hypothetical protein
MIGVLVGDENPIQTFRRARNGGEPLADLTSGEAGVDQETRLGRFQIGAVASGTAAENSEVDRHTTTLEARGNCGKQKRKICAQHFNFASLPDAASVFPSAKMFGNYEVFLHSGKSHFWKINGVPT